jgi:hypothetical protein
MMMMRSAPPASRPLPISPATASNTASASASSPSPPPRMGLGAPLPLPPVSELVNGTSASHSTAKPRD